MTVRPASGFKPQVMGSTSWLPFGCRSDLCGPHCVPTALILPHTPSPPDMKGLSCSFALSSEGRRVIQARRHLRRSPVQPQAGSALKSEQPAQFTPAVLENLQERDGTTSLDKPALIPTAETLSFLCPAQL